ncbi:MAG: Transcriptional regulator NovG [bacterium ADurb.Bin429]|nr:MAG: Transcriptional regulator NovG [bacterium ADurb.Bin429]
MDTVSVNDLVFDRALNPRAHGVDQEVVEFYAGIFEEVVWPPIVADRATKKLLDGWHRVEAAKRAGAYSLPVLWVDAKEEELFAHAVKLNLGHGLRLTREERLRAVAKLAREGWTPERIVEFLGCTPILVKQAEQAEDLRAHFRATQHPGAALPTESLAEVAKLEPVDRDAVAWPVSGRRSCRESFTLITNRRTIVGTVAEVTSRGSCGVRPPEPRVAPHAPWRAYAST